MAIYLSDDDVRTLLPMEEAIKIVEDALAEYARGTAFNRPRYRLRTANGILHLMPAAVPHLGVMGYKSYATAKGNPAAPVLRIMLHDFEAGHLQAIIEAYSLTQIRTGAASAVATKYMARKSSTSLGLFGAGFQGEAQILGISAVATIKKIRIYDINRERRDRCCEKIGELKGADVRGVDAPEEAVREMDIVTTCTSSTHPILFGKWVSQGMHINAVGSNALTRREVDGAVISRSTVIVVDDRETAMIECGDLLEPYESGMIHWEQIPQLGEVVTGKVKGRTSDKDITLFESHGIAVEDIATAAYVYRLALKRGIGKQLPL